ncbi:MAG: GHKL domain-containing protein [Clostridiales bacterium]|nr:GHKL domain-containing protein [Clostridiales bacterium]
MKKSLLSRFIFCYLALILAIFILMNTLGMRILENRLKDDAFDQLYKEADLIRSEYITNFYDNRLTLEDFTKQLRSIDTYLDIRVWIVNSYGTIISDSAYISNAISLNLNELNPAFLEKQYSEYTVFTGILNGPVLSVIQPISYDYQIRGYIVLHRSLETIKNDAIYYMDIINICLLIFSPLLLVIFLYIFFITSRPMKQLMKAAIEYSLGNYKYNLSIKGPREYQDLGAALSYMASEINKLDDYQKRFIANISHDFRSPLTSIKGYAEAILDGTIPYEMQDKYLNIIRFETERLNKLTSSLLELNSFENSGAFLDIVTFDINYIIKKTAESFDGICMDKKITLNLLFSEKETLVDADMGKIQQVLYNLIDNAIKFSQANSEIKVTSEEKGDKVFISVKDNGIGIPREAIKKIWDRFYKTDSSRGKDKIGTGLGLSIAKEIIQAHNENINVISTEGVGTEFTFTLTKSS